MMNDGGWGKLGMWNECVVWN